MTDKEIFFEWLEVNDCRKKFMRAFDGDVNYPDFDEVYDQVNYKDLIDFAFTWSSTFEGHNYWSKMSGDCKFYLDNQVHKSEDLFEL